ncbi:hypothetical protein REPUB_Repub01dG0183500 [Reevesia pubescens]
MEFATSDITIDCAPMLIQGCSLSIDYRRAPEHPIHVAYGDSWAALKFVASNYGGTGPEDWLNCNANFDNVYFSGDSASGNIVHHIAIKIGQEKMDGINLVGIVLVHPYFWGKEPVGNEIKYPTVKENLNGFGVWPLL